MGGKAAQARGGRAGGALSAHKARAAKKGSGGGHTRVLPLARSAAPLRCPAAPLAPLRSAAAVLTIAGAAPPRGRMVRAPRDTVRGYRSGILRLAEYSNLTQCETLEDLKLHLSSTDYGNFLANEPSPLATTTIAEVGVRARPRAQSVARPALRADGRPCRAAALPACHTRAEMHPKARGRVQLRPRALGRAALDVPGLHHVRGAARTCALGCRARANARAYAVGSLFCGFFYRADWKKIGTRT